MSNEYVTVRNLVTRKVGQVRRRIAEHAIFGKNLEIVPEGTKSYVSLDELIHGRDLGPKTVDDLDTPEYFELEEEYEDDYEKEDEA